MKTKSFHRLFVWCITSLVVVMTGTSLSAQSFDELVSDTLAVDTIAMDTLSVSDVVEEEVEISFFNKLEQDSVGGKLMIHADPALRQMDALIARNQKAAATFEGYRIQIYSESSYKTSMDKMNGMVRTFKRNYPGIPIFLEYFEPDFKIRVGVYRTRMDAMTSVRRLRYRYPNCYPVRVSIPISEVDL